VPSGIILNKSPGTAGVRESARSNPASRALARSFGYLFSAGDKVQGYLNLKAYWEFDAQNRARGWNTWLTCHFLRRRDPDERLVLIRGVSGWCDAFLRPSHPVTASDSTH
jgi:hypothetical protein